MLDPEKKRWTAIYPVYLNAKKTTAEGRRIAKTKSVENPTANEIFEACKALKFDCVLEAEKAYPRDYTQKGRVRVKIKQDKAPLNPEIPNRRVLLVKISEQIPKLQSRQGKKAGGAGTSGGGGAGQSSGGGGGSGSKRRKGRK